MGAGLGIKDRSTTDVLILLIATTICLSVLAAGATVAVVEVVHPESDTSQAVGAISDVINTLIGLLAGFLAGRTQTHMTFERGRIEARRDHEPAG
jgi:hypothetical protein